MKRPAKDSQPSWWARCRENLRRWLRPARILRDFLRGQLSPSWKGRSATRLYRPELELLTDRLHPGQAAGGFGHALLGPAAVFIDQAVVSASWRTTRPSDPSPSSSGSLEAGLASPTSAASVPLPAEPEVVGEPELAVGPQMQDASPPPADAGRDPFINWVTDVSPFVDALAPQGQFFDGLPESTRSDDRDGTGLAAPEGVPQGQGPSGGDSGGAGAGNSGGNASEAPALSASSAADRATVATARTQAAMTEPPTPAPEPSAFAGPLASAGTPAGPAGPAGEELSVPPAPASEARWGPAAQDPVGKVPQPLDPLATVPTSSTPASAPSQGTPDQAPLAFEANWGQVDPAARFIARGAGYNLFLTPTEAVFDVAPTAAGRAEAAVQMRLVGADTTAPVAGVDELPGKSNYLIGNDPSKWLTDVPNFASVQYRDVYQGVDLTYHASPDNNLEYDFTVAPGGDVAAIRMQFQGVTGLRLDGQGNLVLGTAAGDLTEKAPTVYQQDGSARQAVSARFVLLGNSQVGFAVGDYDHSRPLVIDPVLVGQTFLGGSGADAAYAVASSPSGNLYVTGSTTSLSFPSGGPSIGPKGLSDVFVTELNPAGTQALYTTYIGSSSADNLQERGLGIAVNPPTGEAYVVGVADGSDFPLINAFDATYDGQGDGFALKLNAAGNALEFSTYLGGSSWDKAQAVALDSQGMVHVVGATASPNFSRAPGDITTLQGTSDAFVTVLSPTGSVVSSRYWGGGGDDAAWGVATDSSGNSYLVGSTSSAGLATPGAVTASFQGGTSDGFVAVVSSNGTSGATTYLGGSGADTAYAVARGPDGSLYVTGSTSSPGLATMGNFGTQLSGPSDAFVTRLAPDLTGRVFFRYLGGQSSETGYAITASPDGSSAAVTGSTQSSDYPTVNPVQAGLGGGDAFASQVSSDGSTLLFSSYLGGSAADSGQGITQVGSVLDVVGSTASSNLPLVSPLPGQGSLGGSLDAFVSRIDTQASSLPSVMLQVPDPSASDTSPVDPGLFVVQRSGPTTSAIVVNYSVGGTAVPGTDYQTLSGSVTIAAGQTSAPINVTPIDDLQTGEPPETVVLTLQPSAGYTLGSPTSGTVTISDNNPVPTLSVNDVSLTEGNAGTTSFTFAVTLSSASTQTVTVNYSTADGTATTVSGDYLPTSGMLTFNPEETSKTVTVAVQGDTVPEPDETFTLNLSNATNANVTRAQGTGTILNDDFPSLSVNDVSVTEGNSGTTNATFTVSLSTPAVQPVSVQYATADGTATVADNDYTARTGTLNFVVGQSSETITVPVAGDTKVELDETFTFNLSNPTNATIARAQATGTIRNDDLPGISVDDVSLAEGDSGITPFTFTVRLDQPSPQTVTVNYATADGTATAANNDYVSTAGTLNFTPGQTEKTVTVSVNGDTTPEANETFFVNLSAPTNATVTDSQGAGTILNDDLPALSIGNALVEEGNSGPTSATFTVTLAQPAGQTVTVDYTTADGTATLADNDYNDTFGTLTFDPGETQQTITVPVVGDTKVEPDETFFVNLSDATNAVIAGAQGTGTISDDDGTPTVSVAATDASAAEGTPPDPGNFRITRAGQLLHSLTVSYTLAGSTASASDYVETFGGSITFAPGEVSKDLPVTPVDDTLAEPTETVVVTLLPGAGYAVGTQGAATVSIADNDSPDPGDRPPDAVDTTISTPVNVPVNVPVLAGDSDPDGDPLTVTAVTQGAHGTVAANADGTVSYTPAWGWYGTDTFDYTISDGRGGGDRATVTVTVPTPGQPDAPGDTLGTAQPVSLTSGQQTIINGVIGDGPYGERDVDLYQLNLTQGQVLSAAIDASSLDGGGSLSGLDSGLKLFDSAGNTLVWNDDNYDPVTGQYGLDPLLVFPVETTGTYYVGVSGYPNFGYSPLSGGSGEPGSEGAYQLQLGLDTIGTVVTVEATDPTTSEANGDPATFTLRRIGDLSSSLDVSYNVGGTALDSRYTGLTRGPGVAHFDAGQDTVSLSFTAVDDRLLQGDETVTLTLAAGDGYSLATVSSATATILDNDSAVTILATQPDAQEGPTPTPGVFTLTRVGDLSAPATVSYTVSGTAGPGRYQALSGTVSFDADQQDAEVDVTPIDDGVLQGTEAVTLTLQDTGTYLVGDQSQATVRILDDEAASATVVTATATAPSADEESRTPGEITLYRTGDTAGYLTVAYALGGTATPSDYLENLSGYATFQPGQDEVHLSVTPLDDHLFEAAEILVLTLNPGDDYALGNATTATVTIAEHDVAVSVSAGLDAVKGSPSTPGTFTLTRQGDLSAATTVSFTLGGTATASDYLLVTDSVDFGPGQATAPVTITPVDDGLSDGFKTVSLTLLPDGDNLYLLRGQTQATLGIADADATGTVVTVAATAPDASEQGPTPGQLTFYRTGSLAAPLDVSYGLDGSTAAPSRYSLSSTGPVYFDAGQDRVTLTVTPVDDSLPQGAQTVEVTLTSGTGYSVGAVSSATVNIADNDKVVSLSVPDANAAEGTPPDPGSFVITRQGDLSHDLTVNYAVGGTAGSGDYVGLSGTSVTIPKGQASQTLTIYPLDNMRVTGDQTVTLTLGTGDGYTLGDTTSGTVTIAEGDTEVDVTASTPDAVEGSSPTPGAFTFTRTGATASALTVGYSLAGTSATSSDYQETLTGQVYFAPGQATATQSITPTTGGLDGTKAVVLTLDAGAGYLLGAAQGAVVDIEDDPSVTETSGPVVTVAATDPSAAEQGQDPGQVTFYRTGDLSSPLTVNYSTTGSTTSAADWVQSPPGTVTFAAGASKATLDLTPVDDRLAEGPEYLAVGLLPGTGYTMGAAASARVDLADNEWAMTAEVTAPDATEGNPGTPGSFQISRPQSASDRNLTVTYQVSGSATPGLDYVPLTGSVILPQGVTSVAVPVTPLEDGLSDGPETVVLTLLPQEGYPVGTDSSATVTIANADPGGGAGAPDATDDQAVTDLGVPVMIDELANDSDPGNPLTVSVAAAPGHGTAVIDPATNEIVYTPGAGFSGADSFLYQVSDGQGGTDEARVSVYVNAPRRRDRMPSAWTRVTRWWLLRGACWPVPPTPTGTSSRPCWSPGRPRAPWRSTPTVPSTTRRTRASPGRTASPTPRLTAGSTRRLPPLSSRSRRSTRHPWHCPTSTASTRGTPSPSVPLRASWPTTATLTATR